MMMTRLALFALLALAGCESDCRQIMIEAGYPPGCITQYSLSHCEFTSATCDGLTASDAGLPISYEPNWCSRSAGGAWPKLVEGLLSGVPFRLYVAGGRAKLTVDGVTDSTAAYVASPGHIKARFGVKLLVGDLAGKLLSASVTSGGASLFEVDRLPCPVK